MTERINQAVSFVSAIIAAGIVVAVAFFLYLLLQEVRPVMSYIVPVDRWAFTDRSAYNDFAGFKIRDCERVIGSEVGLMLTVSGDKKKGYTEGITVRYLGDAGIKNDLPPSNIYLGGFLWTSNEINQATAIGFELAHRCTYRTIYSEYWYDLPSVKDRNIGTPP